jgi:hypothetical protein
MMMLSLKISLQRAQPATGRRIVVGNFELLNNVHVDYWGTVDAWVTGD